MAQKARNSLKELFKKGKMPQDGDFADLIDSMINQADDGISKTIENGLLLRPSGDASQKLLSFFKNIEDKSPIWAIKVDKSNGAWGIYNNKQKPALVITQDENGLNQVGIQTEAPQYELDVQGVVGMTGRIGNVTNRILADGQWHTIIDNLNGCHAFEIMAGAGKPKTGKYALLQAKAISTFGDSNNEIAILQAHYGASDNKIQLRWRGTTFNYSLEMRTKGNYGDNVHIKYFITRLWFDEFMEQL
jgi:hypothetical protein